MYNYNINRRKFLGLIGCCTCGLLIPSCATAPITERRQLKILPESYINRQAFQMYQRVKNSKDIKISSDKVFQTRLLFISFGNITVGSNFLASSKSKVA